MCAFTDISKAFRYVIRGNLWFKFIKLGIRSQILNSIMSMFENVKSQVKFNNAKGEEFVCCTGVRQGECLSPFLFSICVNDLEQELISKQIAGIDLDYYKLFLLMYADDIVLFSETEKVFQNGINCMYDCCQNWKLSVNTQKRSRFSGRVHIKEKYSISIWRNNLEMVNKFIYLGIIFTTDCALYEAQKARVVNLGTTTKLC